MKKPGKNEAYILRMLIEPRACVGAVGGSLLHKAGEKMGLVITWTTPTSHPEGKGGLVYMCRPGFYIERQADGSAPWARQITNETL